MMLLTGRRLCVTTLLLFTTATVSVRACETIGSWKALVAAVQSATNTLSLCPFNITKPSSESLKLKKRLTMKCAGATETSKCVLRGADNHVCISGSEAEVVLDGFAFHDAGCGVRIHSTATKLQEIRNCVFVNNTVPLSLWRGGAIKTEPGTSAIVSNSKFIGNSAADGGAIFHHGDTLIVRDSSFYDNYARQGGSIQSETTSYLEVHDLRPGGAILVTDSSILTGITNTVGTNNIPCNGVYNREAQTCDEFVIPTPAPTSRPTPSPTASPTPSPTPAPVSPSTEPFIPGQLSIKQEGLRLSTGLTVKILAKAGQPVAFTSPERNTSTSTIPFHAEPDGAAVYKLDDGGWVYMSNSEVPSGGGGVYGLEFDSKGRPRSYSQRLKNTTRNCAGGSTPWNTWVSCEEFASGQCWQVDPTGKREPAKTELVEAHGGNFESMAFDGRDPDHPKFYVTEDHERGAIRRFTPSCVPLGWDMLHTKGTIDYLEFLPDKKFQWTSSLARGRQSAFDYYQNVEGISHDNGILSFVAKRKKEIFHLDLDARTYIKDTTIRQGLSGGGSFGAQPDQLMLYSDALYFTEDGGRSPGIYVGDGSRDYTLVEGYSEDYYTDETTGCAFSPDGTKLYFCIQEIGYLFQLERKDGRAFDDFSRRMLGLRFRHSD